MNIILAGIIGRYPCGGVAWCSLMYLLGLRALGHKVWYLEDTGECNYDPVQNTISPDPSYALSYINSALRPYGLENAWCYIDYEGKYHGMSREAWMQVCSDADLFLNLSGGSWFWRDEYARIPFNAFIDSDPAFTQLAISRNDGWYREFFTRYRTLFTFGSNIGTPYCEIPVAPLRWHHTWQPVCMDQWQPIEATVRNAFTTVMSWKILSFEDIGGNKDQEFLKVLDLPNRTKVPFELAVNGPHSFLREHGWPCVEGLHASRDLDNYRDYLRGSLGEFSVAKHTYVSTNSGWFSDRTECYLAAGRPAVVQETGFSRHLPTGEGLFAFRIVEEAAAALERVVAEYPRHRRAARDLAAAHFDAKVVLPALLERCTAGVPSQDGGQVSERPG